MVELRPTRILLVEDDIELRRLYRTALLLEGFAVEEAGDGVSALQMIEDEAPDLIVLDIGLPTLSGVSVQQELATDAQTQSIPILVVTGSHVAVDLPDECVLRKPVSPERFVEEVRRCLHATHARERQVGRVLERKARQKSRASDSTRR